jgi:serine/threonine protein kinase
VQIGSVYNQRFRVLSKLGWGHFSTVWLAQDQYVGLVRHLSVNSPEAKLLTLWSSNSFIQRDPEASGSEDRKKRETVH